MNPGRELDIVIHEVVMKDCPHHLKVYPQDENANPPLLRCVGCGQVFRGLHYMDGAVLVPAYSSDIAAAWKLVAREYPDTVFALIGHPDGSFNIETMKVENPGTPARRYDDTVIYPLLRGQSAPHAICLASLVLNAESDFAERIMAEYSADNI